MSQINTNAILDASGGTTTTINGYTPTVSNMAGRNRIINGDMRIDQRNAGASVSTSSGSTAYTLDRWQAQFEATSKYTVQQSSVAPAGFINSLLVTSTSAYTPTATQWFAIAQSIEGLNISDFAWGTSSAQAINVSFWVRSSLTGTFGGSATNASWGRSYPFSFAINSANTWEQKTVTIAGDTTGTWNTNTSTGLTLRFNLGTGSTYSNTAGSWYGSQVFAPTGATSVVGTSGATFYITGVQLEAGSVATPFEHRQYGQELALCQRYFTKTYDIDVAPGSTNTNGGDRGAIGNSVQTTNSYTSLGNWSFPVTMRAQPTVTTYNPRTGVTNSFVGDGSNYTGVSVFHHGQRGVRFGASNVSVGTHVFVYVAATASAEL